MSTQKKILGGLVVMQLLLLGVACLTNYQKEVDLLFVGVCAIITIFIWGITGD